MQQKIFLGFILTLVIVVFIPIYWVTEPGRQAAARERLKTEAVARGAELYASHCASCHGASGEGSIGPALKNSPLDEKVMVKVISRGVPGKPMPALAEEEGGPLKAYQINDLVTFIKNWEPPLETSSNPPKVPVPTPAPVTAPVSPSINTGELFAGKCAACHGAKREGISGLGPALTPESLGQVSAAEVQETISEGRLAKGMPPYKNIFNQEEIDSLVQLLKIISP